MDPLVELNQENTTPYGYVLGNPVKLTDPDGRFPIIPFIIWAVESGAATYFTGAVAVTTVVVHNSGKSGSIRSTDSDNESGLVDVSPTRFGGNSFSMDVLSRRMKQGQQKAEFDKLTQSGGDNTYNRVKLRKGTLEKIRENQPKMKMVKCLTLILVRFLTQTKQISDTSEDKNGEQGGNNIKKREVLEKKLLKRKIILTYTN